LGQFENAIEYYEKAVLISKETSDKNSEASLSGSIGNAYGHLGNAEKVLEYYEKALAIGKEINDQRIINLCKENIESNK